MPRYGGKIVCRAASVLQDVTTQFADKSLDVGVTVYGAVRSSNRRDAPGCPSRAPMLGSSARAGSYPIVGRDLAAAQPKSYPRAGVTPLASATRARHIA